MLESRNRPAWALHTGGSPGHRMVERFWRQWGPLSGAVTFIEPHCMPLFYLYYLTPSPTWEGKHPYPHLPGEQSENKEGYMTVSSPLMQQGVKSRIRTQVGLSLNFRSLEVCDQTPDQHRKRWPSSHLQRKQREYRWKRGGGEKQTHTHTHTHMSMHQYLLQSTQPCPTVLWLIYPGVSLEDLGENNLSYRKGRIAWELPIIPLSLWNPPRDSEACMFFVFFQKDFFAFISTGLDCVSFPLAFGPMQLAIWRDWALLGGTKITKNGAGHMRHLHSEGPPVSSTWGLCSD